MRTKIDAPIVGTKPLPIRSRPKCLFCHRILNPEFSYDWPVGSQLPVGKTLVGYGYIGNNKFCSLRCGFYWAVRVSKRE